MTSKATAAALASYGFAYDEEVTHKAGRWFGTIDPIGRYSIDGDCRGVTVSGDTRAQMDAEAIEQAKWYRTSLEPCTDRKCPMHGEDSHAHGADWT